MQPNSTLRNHHCHFNVGVFLGTFDPFHLGHLNVIKAVLEQTDMDSVFVVPAMQNPWKERNCTPMSIRRDIIEATLASANPPLINVHVSMVECSLEPPFYSYKTLNELSKRLPEDNLYIIGGCDTMQNISQWKNFDTEIYPNYGFIGINRGDTPLPTHLTSHGTQKEIIPVFNDYDMDISSTLIRQKLANGENCDGLMAPAAMEIVKHHNLLYTS